MKKPIIAMALFASSVAAYAQGQIALDNNQNTSTSPSATSGGLFFIQTGTAPPALINQDFNAAFYGGTDSASLGLIASFSGAGIIGDNAVGPGTFTDPTAGSYIFLGSCTMAFFRIEAWTGNFNSYSAAVASGTALFAQSPVFSNPLACPTATPPDLTSMPAMVLGGVPEPSSFVLAGFGGLCVLLLCRRPCMTHEKVSG